MAAFNPGPGHRPSRPATFQPGRRLRPLLSPAGV
ncbi:hypothetical protein SFR_4572 [Streptomyces sp. FR-008]|nr:hypothetical protein SFR_4572 [Streptomyces sp. FR-008]